MTGPSFYFIIMEHILQHFIKTIIPQKFRKEKSRSENAPALMIRVIYHLMIQTTKNLQIQLLDDFFLRLTSLGVVVKPWRGIDFQHPVFSRCGWLAYVSINHEVNATQTQVHVACESHRQLTESW